jgi:hypothetical protein
VLSLARARKAPNGALSLYCPVANRALSCGVLSRCHIFARLKHRRIGYLYIYICRVMTPHDNAPFDWFGTLCVALSIATMQPISLSYFHLVASDNTTKTKQRVVALSLAQHAKWCVFVRRIVAISPCHLAYKPILRFELSDNVTSRQYAAGQRAVWRTSLAIDRTTRRKSDNAPFGALSCYR